jgi:cation diffusion facilitator family transporter
MGPRHLRRTERVALYSLLVTCVLIVLKFVVWASTSSLAVLSQALDSIVDLVALGLLFVGLRVAGRPADASHHYGHAKAENLVAFTQTLIVGGVMTLIAIEAVKELASGGGSAQAPAYALVLLGVSAVVDIVRMRFLLGAARSEGSDALVAGALNIAGDVGTSVVALVSLLFVRAGNESADAIGALLVVVFVAFAGVRVGKRSVDVLMDRAPGALEAIREAAAAAPGVTEARRVRVRGSGDKLFADVTVAAGRTASLERAHDIAEAVEREIAQVAPGADVVVHVEPASETSGLGERAHAAASRTDGVHEVHNVVVHAFQEDGRPSLHVTLHAKSEPGISLQEAHDLSERIERSVSDELGGKGVRVDTHIEPLSRTTLGKDVTTTRPDIVNAVQALAKDEPDVLDCHEVLITSVDGELAIVAHVRGRNSLALDRMHDASNRIEKGLHRAFPDLGSVLIHFEPA